MPTKKKPKKFLSATFSVFFRALVLLTTAALRLLLARGEAILPGKSRAQVETLHHGASQPSQRLRFFSTEISATSYSMSLRKGLVGNIIVFAYTAAILLSRFMSDHRELSTLEALASRQRGGSLT